VPALDRRWDVKKKGWDQNPGIPTTIKTMGVNITTIAYLRVLIFEIGSTIILMVVEAQGKCVFNSNTIRWWGWGNFCLSNFILPNLAIIRDSRDRY